MDKSKLASIGERLKSGGAQMGRLVSLKVREVKDLLQAPTPESKIVDQATLPAMEAPDWGLNLRICAMINGEELNGTEVVRAIKRKISTGDGNNSQKLALELLEACAMNCEKVFSEIASEKVLDEMVKLIETPQADRECSVRAVEMIRAWGESEDLNYLPVFRQTFENLKQRGMPSHIQEGSLLPVQHSLESYMDEEALSPPLSYPIPDNAPNRVSGDEMPYQYGNMSVEEKKEFLEIARNSIEVLSSLVNSSSDSNPPEDELTMNMLDKCKESQPILQRIVQSTTDDETLLFEALNLHDELQQVISKFERVEVSEQRGAQLPEEESQPNNSGHSNAENDTQTHNKLPDSPKVENDLPTSTSSSTAAPTLLKDEPSSDRKQSDLII